MLLGVYTTFERREEPPRFGVPFRIERTIRSFASRVQVLNAQGDYLYCAHRQLAEHLVSAAIAEPEPGAGRIKAVRLVRIAEHTAAMIGPPSPATIGGVKFHRREKLDSGIVIWSHHVRATNYGE